MSTRTAQDFVVKGKEGFMGLEDSKKTQKIAVRSEKMFIHHMNHRICNTFWLFTLPPEGCFV